MLGVIRCPGRMRPRLLRPDNVTPPARTPWGGRKILDRYKRGLELGDAALLPIAGESWEVSVEPTFLSRLADDGTLLADAIAADPEAWLGRAVAERWGQTPLLVKLVDAAAPLSVQVHPRGDEPALRPDESGKAESWYILDAEPGAGVYLGFGDGVSRREVGACLHGGGRLNELMSFVPVAPGDMFLIPAGTAHAVGGGVTLLEPQFVAPGRRGVTYRYWDWNRRYDEHGGLSATGTPRELHVARSLEATDWDAAPGLDVARACRAEPRQLGNGSLGRTLVADWPYFAVERWAGQGALEVPAPGTLFAVVCVAGAAEIRTEAGACAIRRGQSMVVPCAAGALEVTSRPLGDEDAVELLVTRSN